MKQRSTFLVSDPEHTKPDNFELASDSLQIKAVAAAREDRLTAPFNELPPELFKVIQDCQELYIRWISGKPYTSVDPYGSRLPAGLHVVVKPLRDSIPLVCDIVNPLFEIDTCHGLKESFIELPGAYQFYHPLKSIAHFRQYLQDKVCPLKDEECRGRFTALDDADYIDMKYDIISQSFVGSAFYAESEKSENIRLTRKTADQRVEVGVLGANPPMAEESITLSGSIHVIGDEKMDPVLFTFPSRHHTHPSEFALSLEKPTGLHPKIELSITAPNPAPHEDCTLNAYFTLPRFLFIDKYQLADSNPNFLRSLNITRLRALTGEADLEAPVWSSKLWGSSLLLELDPSSSSFSIPTHLRYLPPAKDKTMETVDFSAPTVFWACKSEEWSQMGNNPFDRVRLGWEPLFPEQTMYHYLSPAQEAGSLWKQIEVPVLGLQSANTVKWGTVGAIAVGFMWILWKVLLAVTGPKEDKKKSQ